MVQVCGLGGVGKSSLANEYVQRELDGGRYELCIFLHANTRTALANDLRKFAKEMLAAQHPSIPAGAPPPSPLPLFPSARRSSSGGASHLSTAFGTLSGGDPLGHLDEDNDESEEADEEIVASDFRRLISNCQSSFVIIFDNLENSSWLSNYLPGFGEGGSSGSGKGSTSASTRASISISNGISSNSSGGGGGGGAGVVNIPPARLAHLHPRTTRGRRDWRFRSFQSEALRRGRLCLLGIGRRVGGLCGQGWHCGVHFRRARRAHRRVVYLIFRCRITLQFTWRF